MRVNMGLYAPECVPTPTWRDRWLCSIRDSVSATPWRHFCTWPCRTTGATAPGNAELWRQVSPRRRHLGGRVTAGRHALPCCWCPAPCPVRATASPTDRPTAERPARRPKRGFASPSHATSQKLNKSSVTGGESNTRGLGRGPAAAATAAIGRHAADCRLDVRAAWSRSGRVERVLMERLRDSVVERRLS